MNEKMNIKAVEHIMSNYVDFGTSAYEIDTFKSYAKKVLDTFDISNDIFDLLFIPGKSGCSILHYFVMENKYGLFSQMLDEYKDKFKIIPASQWEFMLMEKDNDCHKSFIKFYGEEYFQQILKSELSFVTCYSEPSFKKYYLTGELDHFYKLENIHTFDSTGTCEMLHALNFFNADKEGFKKFMIDQSEEQNSSKSYKYEKLIYTIKEESTRNLKDGRNVKIKDIILKLPEGYEVELLIEKWGIDKTSQVISEYLKFQKEYSITANKSNLLKVNFDGDMLNKLIKKKIDFSNCGETLCFGLKNNSAQLAYFIINGIISKDHLLMYIHDKELKTEASYHVLNESLDKKNDIHTPTKRLKV